MHLPTILAVTLMINLMVSFYLFILYQRRPKDKCFKFWAASCLSFVLGGSLAALRAYGFAPIITFFIADVLLLFAPVFILLGLIQFSRLRFTKIKRQRSYSFLALTIIVLFSTHQHAQIANIVAAIIIALLFFICAILLKKSVFSEPVYTRTLQFIFIFHSLIMLLQATLIATHWSSSDPQGLPASTAYTLISHVFLTTLTALLLPWLSFLRLERKLTLKSQRDGLTKLANREYFFSQLEKYWQENSGTSVTLMMIDIDHFKAINDNFGHAKGDDVLKNLASILSKCLRSGDIVARIGGEEFAVLLNNASADMAIDISQRLRQRVTEQMRYLDNDLVNVTISIGLANVTPAQHSFTAALKMADDALYQSKRDGRNTITLSNVEIN
ncbi:diguanylate cyclase [Neptunicella sp.]|uniref:GGDEF domain-containing protein n=1 Tax=Neptunicella sp. TaxID=2125986 RepID=UPI003F6915C9